MRVSGLRTVHNLLPNYTHTPTLHLSGLPRRLVRMTGYGIPDVFVPTRDDNSPYQTCNEEEGESLI